MHGVSWGASAMKVILCSSCRIDQTGTHVIPGITDDQIKALSTAFAEFTNDKIFISGQRDQTITVEIAAGSTIDPYTVNYIVCVDGSRSWRYHVKEIYRTAGTIYTYTCRLDIMHTLLSAATVRCAFYSESNDRGTFIPPISPRVSSTNELPVLEKRAATSFRYVMAFTQSNGNPRMAMDFYTTGYNTAPLAFGVYNSASSYTKEGEPAGVLHAKIALDRIYAIPADVASVLFQGGYTQKVTINGNSVENNGRYESYPAIMLSDGFKTSYYAQKVVTYTCLLSPNRVYWFGGIDGGFTVPFISKATTTGETSIQTVKVTYCLSSYGLHVLASGGGMAEDITSFFDITPSVNNDSAARNLSRVTSAINGGMSIIGNVIAQNYAGAAASGVGTLIADDRLRMAKPQHFSTTSGQKILQHGLGLWSVMADNAGDIDAYIKNRGYCCIGVYEHALDWNIKSGRTMRYIKLMSCSVTGVPEYAADEITARLKEGVILYSGTDGYMGSTNSVPTEEIVESSEDATYTTPEAGEVAVSYTGKTEIRIYREGIEVATYAIKAVDSLEFIVDIHSKVFVYNSGGTAILMPGSICVIDFATEKALFSGVNEMECDHNGFLATPIYPYRDSDGVRTVNIFITNRSTNEMNETDVTTETTETT